MIFYLLKYLENKQYSYEMNYLLNLSGSMSYILIKRNFKYLRCSHTERFVL